MAATERADGDRQAQAPGPHSRLFTVRLWAEEVAGGWEYRGTVQEVVSGAIRSFRTWPDLTEFMIARMNNSDRSKAERMEGETS